MAAYYNPQQGSQQSQQRSQGQGQQRPQGQGGSPQWNTGGGSQIQTQRQGQSPQWSTGGGNQTFAQMQQNGQARPAPPSSWYTGSSSNTGNAPFQFGNGGGYSPPSFQNPTSSTQGQFQPPNPNQVWSGIMNNPMVQWGNQTAGFQPPTMPNGGYSMNGGGSGYQVPPGPAQYGSGPQATGQQQNAANDIGGATQNLLMQQLQNPNPLGSQAFQTQMQQAQTGINENMQQQSDAINSNLAGRGVYDSSLAGGYLKDLSTGAGRQMASIGANLLPQEAQLQLQGTNSALGNSMNYGGQQYGQQLGTAQLNLQQQQQQQQALMNMLGLTQT